MGVTIHPVMRLSFSRSSEKDSAHCTQRQIPYYRRKLGMVFQDFRLLNEKTVYDNVSYALEIVETPRKDIKMPRHFPTKVMG